MALRLSIGESSQTGPRTRNEDYIGVVTPATIQLETKGALLAVADGVSGSAGGAEAAEMTVRSVSADYYATPDTWTIQHALDKVIQAANRWVLSQSRKNNSAMAGMATTLSLLVLRGQRYVLAHVGDTRIYQLREQALLTMTDDHVWDRPDMRHVLKRAVGLDKALTVDYAEGLLKQGDIYAILSDGVWAALSEADIHKNLMLYHNPQLAAEALTQLALEKGSQDNASALVVLIDEVGQDRFSDLLLDAHRLPIPTRMSVGESIDDFTVTEILHDSRVSLLYQVKNRAGQLFVLKTLQPSRAEDKVSSEALLNEEWLAKRVVSHVPQVLPLSREQRTALYYVMSWHAGTTLQQRLDAGHHFTISGVTNIAQDLMRGIGMLHRLNIVHRDIKPANIHLGSDNRLRILDLGVALNTTAPMPEQMENPGTPSFMAPELFDGHLADWRTDIYAAGVTLYHLLTGKYPYGEIEPFQSPRFGEPVRPSRYRPEIPAWLENIILKAIARIPENRFETAEEMLLALEQGELSSVFIPRTPLIARARLVKWQWLAIISLCVNLLLIYLLLVS